MMNIEGAVPYQFTPVISFYSTVPGYDLTDYARGYLIKYSLATSDSLDAEAHNFIYSYRPDPAALPMAPPETVLSRFPAEVRDTLKKKEKDILGVLEKIFYLPDGEQIVASRMNCLAQEIGDMPAGTLVYVRETNIATINFLLPHFRVDLVSGELIPPSTTVLRSPAPAVGGPVSGSEGITIVTSALEISQCLVWAMPHPWGAVGAAGITLFEMLFNGLTQAGQDPFKAMADQIKDFIMHRDINNWARDINELVQWMLTQQSVLKNIRGNETEYIINSLLPELRRETAPGASSIYDAIYGLSDEQYIKEDGVFDVLMAGISVYLMALKMIIQLDALIASNYYDAGNLDSFDAYNRLWRGDYANYVVNILGDAQKQVAGWATRMQERIARFKSDRLGQIRAPYRWSYTVRSATGGGGQVVEVTYSGWTYVDRIEGNDKKTHFYEDTYSGGCHGKTIEHRDECANDYNNHVKTVSDGLNAKYADAVSTVQKWISVIDEWNQHLPPLQPKEKIALSGDGWGGVTPQGDWKTGNAVNYAVAFANALGVSPMGPWSGFYEIQDKAFPTLVVPADPLRNATVRYIYRKFREGKTTCMLAGVLNDNATTAFQDKKG